MSGAPFDLQPVLSGSLVELRPLHDDDYDALFAAASDPLIWEQHPEPDRYTPEVFARFFRGAVDSGGALLASDAATKQVIGTSRFVDYTSDGAGQVEIGYTFLARSHWGGRYNAEMKELMLTHALRFVGRVVFVIGPQNVRSQRAVEKVGARRVPGLHVVRGRESVIYEITRSTGSV